MTNLRPSSPNSPCVQSDAVTTTCCSVGELGEAGTARVRVKKETNIQINPPKGRLVERARTNHEL